MLCCLVHAAAGQAKDDRRGREIMRLEGEWREAQQHNDRAGFERLLSPKLTFVGTSGSFRDKPGFIARRGGSWILRAEAYTYADLAVRVCGKAAIVNGLEATTGAGVAAQARFTHVWARSKRKWLLVAVQRTEVMPSP